jgi:hypothetical protein
MPKDETLVVWLFFTVACALAVIAAYNVILWQAHAPVVARLVKVDGGQYAPATRDYRGTLNLTVLSDNSTLAVFACAPSWAWVRVGECYSFDPGAVQKSVESNLVNARDHGCYASTLNQTECPE